MRNLDNFRQAVESPKSWNSMGYICLKTTFLHLKHYLQIYLTLLSTDLWFGKWHEEYDTFSPEHMKVSKLGFCWDPLIQNWKSMSLKTLRGVICHDNEEWCKISRGIGLSFQSWHEEIDKFNVLPSRKVYIVCAKKVQRSYLWWKWIGIQNLERNHLVVSKLA